MISAFSLWLPIVLAGALVFVASSVIHMFLGYHKHDHRAVPDEDGVMDALRGFDLAPGEYAFPRAASMKEMGSDEFRAKHERGPVATLSVMRPGLAMGRQLGQWFLYCVVVSFVAAYLAGQVHGAGADYLGVFQVSGTTAFAAYAMGAPTRSIWFAQSWGTAARNMFDGLVYALLTGGVFGWLWP